MAAAGPEAELAPLVAKLKEEGVFVRELNTLGIAYHSPALDPFCGRLRTRAPSSKQLRLCARLSPCPLLYRPAPEYTFTQHAKTGQQSR